MKNNKINLYNINVSLNSKSFSNKNFKPCSIIFRNLQLLNYNVGQTFSKYINGNCSFSTTRINDYRDDGIDLNALDKKIARWKALLNKSEKTNKTNKTNKPNRIVKNSKRSENVIFNELKCSNLIQFNNNHNQNLCIIAYQFKFLTIFVKLSLLIIVYVKKNLFIIIFDNNNKSLSVIRFNKKIQLNQLKQLSINEFKISNRYSLDSQYDNEVMDLIRIEIKSLEMVLGYFIIDKRNFCLDLVPRKPYLKLQEMCITDFIFTIKRILNELNVILDTGYLNTHNLMDYPIIKDFITIFTSNEDYINGKFSHESYKWIFNIINLTIYKELIDFELLQKDKIDYQSDFELENYYELNILIKRVYSKLDPSIRKGLQKVGISLIQNVETGFDSEYVNVNSLINKPLSFQLALVLQNYIKIPKQYIYKLEKINPLTETNYKVKTTVTFDFSLMELIISKHITTIRNILFGDYDLRIKKLNELLVNDTSINSVITSDSLLIRLKESNEKTFIKILDEKGYSLKEMLWNINDLVKKDILSSRKIIMDQLTKIITKIDTSKDEEIKSTESLFEIAYDLNEFKEEYRILTSLSRNRLTVSSNQRLSVTYIYNNILIGHNTSADLSLLTDFDLFKDELDIVNKGMITIGKGFNYEGFRVQIRDTMLLAPAGSKSLSNLGKLYNFDKIVLSDFDITHMDLLLEKDKERFLEYALRDAQITLKHAIWMENFNFNLRSIGIPITLSSIGNKYVKNYWYESGYSGYQLAQAPDYLIGDSSSIQTPLGLSKIGELALKLDLYISNYKGGRNESFMYGVDYKEKWYDYDLTSAYTTILSNAGHPDYIRFGSYTPENLEKLSFKELINSYIIIRCSFEFPDMIKYPSIPVYVDESSTVYPLQGSGVLLTGAEYYLAKSQNCKFFIDEIFIVPFYYTEIKELKIPLYPFKSIINEIQSKRREHIKGTISNMMYKEIGNSIYGSVVRGMGDKRKYDNKTGQTIRLKAHFLTNPLIASWLTGYIRSVIGECLHNIQLLEGKIVSVTTDGFITTIANLEEEILTNEKCSKTNSLLKSFRLLRKELSGKEDCLELKQKSIGIISWSTRGQIGITTELRATTGFQNKFYTQENLITLFGGKLKIYNNNNDRTIEFLQTTLRSALEISKFGGHVTMKYEDRKFSLMYDNRREILDDELIKVLLTNNNIKLSLNETEISKIELINKHKRDYYYDNFETNKTKSIPNSNEELIFKENLLLDSKPLKDSTTCLNLRKIASKLRVLDYNQRTSLNPEKKYKNYTDIAIRNFIKGIYSNPPIYSGIADNFNDYSSLIEFIKTFKNEFKISKQSISNLKQRSIIHKQVPKTDQTIAFVKYLKTKFPDFDESLFYKN